MTRRAGASATQTIRDRTRHSSRNGTREIRSPGGDPVQPPPLPNMSRSGSPNGGLSGVPKRLAHRLRPLGLDFVDDANLAGLPPRILVHAHILLRHLVDVLVGPVLGNLDHTTLQLQIAIRI